MNQFARDLDGRLNAAIGERDATLAWSAELFNERIGELGAAEAAEPPEPSITPSLPSAYDPERDQLVVLAETPEPPEHACNCTPMVSDAACPEHGMREFLRQVFEALDAEPPEGIEALRPEGEQP